MKKFLAILMALCMLLSMAACGKPADDGVTTIRFWQAGGDTVGAASVMRLLLDKFELQNPGIKVEYQHRYISLCRSVYASVDDV